MAAKLRKAVFPAAGLGTRLLPAIKASPKEMLPVVDKPPIQYGVEEAIQSGVENKKEALGLGHAVLRAKELIGYGPFAVVLSNDIIAAQKPCIRQLTDVPDQYGASVLALMEVPKEQISAYGVVDAEPVPGNDRLFKIRNMVEKPKAADAPSNPAIIGRYVLRLKSSGASSRLDRAAAGRLN